MPEEEEEEELNCIVKNTQLTSSSSIPFLSGWKTSPIILYPFQRISRIPEKDS